MAPAAEKKENTGDPKAVADNLRPGFGGHANVQQSRLNDGGDMAWKGKRGPVKSTGKHKPMM